MRYRDAIMGLQPKQERRFAVMLQIENCKAAKSVQLLNDLVVSASELPPDCQDWVLMLVKSMAYTNKLNRSNIQNQPRNTTKKEG